MFDQICQINILRRADWPITDRNSHLHLISADSRIHDLTEGIFANGESVWRDINFAMLEPAPVVLLFLAWVIKNELDESS